MLLDEKLPVINCLRALIGSWGIKLKNPALWYFTKSQSHWSDFLLQKLFVDCNQKHISLLIEINNSLVKSSCVNNRARLDNKRGRTIVCRKSIALLSLCVVGCCAFQDKQELSTLLKSWRQLLTRFLRIINNERLFGWKKRNVIRFVCFCAYFMFKLSIFGAFEPTRNVDSRWPYLESRFNKLCGAIHTASFEVVMIWVWYLCKD